MTQSFNDRLTTGLGTGVLAEYTYDFYIEASSELIVEVDGVLVDSADYTVDLEASTVTFDTAPADGAKIAMKGKLDVTQIMAYSRASTSIRLEQLEIQLDALTRAVQEAKREAEYAIRNDYSGAAPRLIGTFAANDIAKFDSDGNLIPGPSSTDIDNAAANAAAAAVSAAAASDSADAADASAVAAAASAVLAASYEIGVSSVAMTVPTGLSVSGSPITSTGTLAVTWTAGYQGYTAAEAAKLAAIEALADVTDTANVTAAGALMDSECTNLAAVKALDQDVQASASPTWVKPTVKAIKETNYAVTGTTPAIAQANGGIQYWTLTGNSTPTSSLNDGESVTLMIDDGTAYTVTWTSLVDKWKGGSAPTLPTTGYAVIELWKANGVVYAAYVGDMA